MSDSRPGWDQALGVMDVNWSRNGGGHLHNIAVLEAVYPVLMEALTTHLREPLKELRDEALSEQQQEVTPYRNGVLDAYDFALHSFDSVTAGLATPKETE